MDLYALPPERFTAARDAAAKDDKSLKALRRPTVSAWVVNTLVRREPLLLEDLLALGASLAEAQAQGQGAALRRLTEQRRELVAAVTERAVALVGRDLSPAARAEVSATLEAALADRASAEAVRSGQLVRPLAYAGWGPVDLVGAVAALPSPARHRRPGARVAELEAAALEAAGALDDAVRVAERARRALEQSAGAVDTAEHAQAAAADHVRAAELALQERRRETAAAKAERDRAAKESQAATAAVAAAQKAADAARQALHRERGGESGSTG